MAAFAVNKRLQPRRFADASGQAGFTAASLPSGGLIA